MNELKTSNYAIEYKWYNVEFSKELKNQIDTFKIFLRENLYKFEVSEAYNMIHFEIYMKPNDVDFVNSNIDVIFS